MSSNIIEFKNVTKRYRLYKNDKKRLISLFWKKTPFIEKKAVDEVNQPHH